MTKKYDVIVEYVGPGAAHMRDGGSCDGFSFTHLQLHTADSEDEARRWAEVNNIGEFTIRIRESTP